MAGFVSMWAISLACAAVAICTLIFFLRPSTYNNHAASNRGSLFTVLVLGDIGRSPRMQYHAISLAKHGAAVDIVGFTESAVHPKIASNSMINVVALVPPPSLLQRAPRSLFAVAGPLKVIWQSLNLLWVLAYGTKPSRWMLVQNPPSIPVLVVAQMVCRFRGTHLVIDWHNLGWSVLALKLGYSHPLVRMSKFYERVLAKKTSHHLAVSKAMVAMLRRDFGIDAQPLYDRPMELFKPLKASERASFLQRLPQELPAMLPFIEGLLSHPEHLRLIVSSTSWTPDEDFSILLDALREYSRLARRGANLPNIVALITGKGPQKPLYMPLIDALNKESTGHVFILTGWLSTESYAHLLGAADLGVSLHISASGVDLPMKVVDMLGSGLPVVGWSDFEAWPELVTEGVNGMGFRNSRDLSALMSLLFSDAGQRLAGLKEGAIKDGGQKWDDEWNAVAGRLFRLTN